MAAPKKTPSASARKSAAANKLKTPKSAVKAPVQPKKYGKRADFGSPIEVFFEKQPAPLRPIVDALRELIDAAAPEAVSSLKWGMPVYMIDGVMMCAIGAHKAHVNLILAGPVGAFPDPDGLLSGEGKTGRQLKVRTLDELPKKMVAAWIRSAAKLARQG